MQTAPSTFDTSAPRLVARGLACRRGERRLFEGLDVALQPGELVWLRGRNGSGKSSLLRLLAGLATPEAGTVRIDGEPVSRRPGAVAYLGHANALQADLTVHEALTFLLRLHGLRCDRLAVDAALGRVGAAAQAHLPVRRLSQGQRRRVALARLAADPAPRVWLLDEPHDALDAEGASRLDQLIAAQVAAGGAVLLAAHQRTLCASLRPRILDLDAA